MTRVLFVLPPGFREVFASHEGTVGMGLLVPSPYGETEEENGKAAVSAPAGTPAAAPVQPFLYPPHTLAACLAAARAADFEVSVIDGSYERDPGLVAQRVIAAKADILAVQVSQGTALTDENFLHMVRSAGGSRPTLLYGNSAHLASHASGPLGCADAVLCGEPDLAIAPALELVAGGDLKGMVTASQILPPAYDGLLLRDLDNPPFPAWDITPWHPYGRVSLLTSRGCDAGCRFCAYVVAHGTSPRAQSVERTFAEWQWLHRTIRPPRVIVRDPVFARDRARVAALCERVIQANVPLPFVCESRPEHFDRELLRLLKAAGCRVVQTGMESGDPQTLVALGRAPNVEAAKAYLDQVQAVARECARLDLECRVFVMAGSPGAGPDESAVTHAALARLDPAAIIHAAAYRRYPGVALDADPAGASSAALEALKRANHPAPPLWRRAVHALRGSLRTGDQSPRQQVTFPAAPPEPQDAAETRAAALATLRGKSVFLTGGNGFVGGHVAQALCDAGAQVVALVRPDSKPGLLDDLPLEIVRGDLADVSAWAEALSGSIYCFHVAALYATPDRAAEMYAVNVRGTIHLLAACAGAGVQRFIYTSTIGTVGTLPGAPLTGSFALPDERVPFNLWDAASPYVRSKHLAEQAVLAWTAWGVDTVVVKPAAPVGRGDARPSATGRRILAVLQGEAPSYPSGGVNHAPVIDIAAGHLLAAVRGAGGRSYILGHARGNLSYAEFVRLVRDAAGLPPAEPGTPRSSGLLGGLTANPARAIGELALPQTALAEAFQEAVQWFRANTERGAAGIVAGAREPKHG